MACNSLHLAPLFEKEKLTANGGNYEDWIHTLRYVLRSAKKEYVLDQPLVTTRRVERLKMLSLCFYLTRMISVVKVVYYHAWIKCYRNVMNNSVLSKLSKHLKFCIRKTQLKFMR